jgi:hypothetical protein
MFLNLKLNVIFRTTRILLTNLKVCDGTIVWVLCFWTLSIVLSSPKNRTVFLDNDRTMHNVQKQEIYFYKLYRLHPVVYKILDYLFYNRQYNTFLMYNLLMFYKYIYATCFDHNFGHHQALNTNPYCIQSVWLLEMCSFKAWWWPKLWSKHVM